MNTTPFSAIAVTLGLFGCAAGSSGPGGPTLPVAVTKAPTASTGYASPTDSILAAGITFTDTVPLMYFDGTGNGAKTATRDYSITTTADPNVFDVAFDSVNITVTWDAINGYYYGVNGTDEIYVYPGLNSTNQQVSIATIQYFDNSVGGGALYGSIVNGFNTDPTVVDAMSGTATYSGSSYLGMYHGAGPNRGSIGRGTVDLTADFSNSSISGSMSLTDVGSDPGYAISSTTIGINSTAIVGNAFITDLNINAADLGIGSVTSTQLNGQFYEANATAVGGSFFGAGVGLDGTTPVNIQGGFLGQ